MADNGAGSTVQFQGTGGRILEGLARSIRAEMHGKSDLGGTTVTIVVPARGDDWSKYGSPGVGFRYTSG